MSPSTLRSREEWSLGPRARPLERERIRGWHRRRRPERCVLRVGDVVERGLMVVRWEQLTRRAKTASSDLWSTMRSEQETRDLATQGAAPELSLDSTMPGSSIDLESSLVRSFLFFSLQLN